LGILQLTRCNASQTVAIGILIFSPTGFALPADPPAGAQPAASADALLNDGPKDLPQTNFFSSVKQSLRMGYDHEVVRGHFDLGAPPNQHRYYCLVDTKTRSKEPNGVLGQPVPQPDGTTGLKIDSVSLFACKDAEKEGMLVTQGYLLNFRGPAMAASPNAPAAGQMSSAASTVAPAPAAVPAPTPAPPAAPPPQTSATAPARPEVSLQSIDVAGVRLGMPPEEVRAVLKSKRLHEYTESMETLSYLDTAKGAMQSLAGGRFVSVIATWTPPSAGGALDADGESYEVMFTPVPGKERAMAIVHSVGYSPANAVHEIALEEGLVKKYGGFAASNNLPESPTWRFQSGGNVLIGDPCNRRELFGGLGGLNAAAKPRANIALKKSPEEFRFQIEHCGAAIVTEDHSTANPGALSADRLVTRFTVTAYSPPIALEGSQSAVQLIQAARGTPGKADGPRPKDQAAPNL
jgi:hypothetical protein